MRPWARSAILAEFERYESGRRRLVGIGVGRPCDLEREQAEFEAETEHLIASIVRDDSVRKTPMPTSIRRQVRRQAKRWFEAFSDYIRGEIDKSWTRLRKRRAEYERRRRRGPDRAKVLAKEKRKRDSMTASERERVREWQAHWYQKNAAALKRRARARYWANVEANREKKRSRYATKKMGSLLKPGPVAEAETSSAAPSVLKKPPSRRGRRRLVRRARLETEARRLLWLDGASR